MKKRFLIALSIIAIILIFNSCNNNDLMYSGGAAPKSLIPAGAEVVSAELNLYAYGVYSTDPVNIHRITSGWDEYAVTWNNFNGSYNSEVISTTQIVAGWQSFNITPYISGWLHGDYENHGLLLDQYGTHKFIRYYSREAEFQPYIQLSYMINGTLLVDDPEVVSADAYIWEWEPDNNGGSSTTLYTGYIDGLEHLEKQTLIKFDLEEESGEIVGTGTPGYWKNHPEAWPVVEISIGGITYAMGDAIDNMSMPIKKDKWYSMFRTLVAAKLNILNGSPDVVADTVSAADQWMVDNHHLTTQGLEPVLAKSDAWAEGSEYHSILDDYNNGLIDGAPHRD